MQSSKKLSLLAASLSVAATLGMDVSGVAVIIAFAAAVMALCE